MNAVSLSLFERAIASCVLFYGAMVLCLPVSVFEDMVFPWWATKIGIGNVLLHELLLFTWLMFYGPRLLSAILTRGNPIRPGAIWLVALALWCGFISLGAPLPAQDIGRTLRLLLQAVLLFAVVRWTVLSGNFSLGMLIVGFFAGTVINLTLSFDRQFIVNDAMRLLGQNTPGVAMGMAIHFSAWLFFRASQGSVRAFAVIAALVFSFGCGLSYSRIGWFCGTLGTMAWVYVLIAARPGDRVERQRMKRSRRVWIPLVAIGLASLLTSAVVREQFERVETLLRQKLSQQTDGTGDAGRMAYVTGVGEILLKHPFGVGYSGFFAAMTATEIYRRGEALEEVSLEANPHAAFLWYAAAGGVPGGLMFIVVFALLLSSMRHGLRAAMGKPGVVLSALAGFSLLLIGLTVTYLLNSTILIVPAAIAAGWGWSRRISAPMADPRFAS